MLGPRRKMLCHHSSAPDAGRAEVREERRAQCVVVRQEGEFDE